MSIKLDLHVHSHSQKKILITLKQFRSALKYRPLDGAAVTNFFDISHAIWLKNRLKEYIIIIGQEISTTDGHIIGLGLKQRISDFQSAEETINDIHAQGGIAIAPHPYLHLGVGRKITSLPLDAIESFNGLAGPSFIPNYLAMRCARRYNIPQSASTDTTDVNFIGTSYTEVMVNNPALILEAIRLGKVKLHKKSLPLPIGFIIKNILNFKNIEPYSLHAFPCFICGKAVTIRLLAKKWVCLDCGKVKGTRIACCNGHFLCKKCLMRRNLSSLKEITFI